MVNCIIMWSLISSMYFKHCMTVLKSQEIYILGEYITTDNLRHLVSAFLLKWLPFMSCISPVIWSLLNQTAA